MPERERDSEQAWCLPWERGWQGLTLCRKNCVYQVRALCHKKRKKFQMSFSRVWSFCKAVINTLCIGILQKDICPSDIKCLQVLLYILEAHKRARSQTNIASLRWLRYILLAHWIPHLHARPTSYIKCSPMFTVKMRSSVHKQTCYKLLNIFMAGKLVVSLSSILQQYWNSPRHFLTIL